MIRNLILALLLCATQLSFSQNKFTISGEIKDSKTGEKLVGVTVYNEKTKSGTFSNNSGYYSLSLQKGNYKISYSFIGYETVEKEIKHSKDIKLNIQLIPSIKNI